MSETEVPPSEADSPAETEIDDAGTEWSAENDAEWVDDHADEETDVKLADQSWKPELGTIFNSLVEAEVKLIKWVIDSGFELRRGHSKKGIENLRTYKSIQV